MWYYLCNLQLKVGCVIKIQALRHQVFVVVFVCIITFRVWSSLAWKKTYDCREEKFNRLFMYLHVEKVAIT